MSLTVVHPGVLCDDDAAIDAKKSSVNVLGPFGGAFASPYLMGEPRQ